MKEDKVPQDVRDFKSSEKVTKLIYAVDKDGHYAGHESLGWAPENESTKIAWEESAIKLKEIEEAVRQNKVSPLAYFMEKSMMTPGILARYVGKWAWQVKRHLKPKTFAKLSENVLEKYSKVFNVTIEELKTPF